MIRELGNGVKAAAILWWRARRSGRSFSEQVEHETAAHERRMRDAMDEARTRGVPLRTVLEEHDLI